MLSDQFGRSALFRAIAKPQPSSNVAPLRRGDQSQSRWCQGVGLTAPDLRRRDLATEIVPLVVVDELAQRRLVHLDEHVQELLAGLRLRCEG